MQAKIVGTQRLEFTNSNGDSIKGVNIFTVYPEENVDGLRVDKFFLKDGINLPKDVKLNDTVDISFNRKGKIEMISKA
jgi:hypothetical protein